MKLIACHIENYGKISDADYDFKETITQFCNDNGYGKTTLASFLKAMFYGLPSYRSNSKDFNDRKHFYPFNGGKFGGNVTFEVNGKRYRVERFFDKKSDTEDSLTVYCNGKQTHELDAGVGKTLFGLDENSFNRTVFITGDDVEIGATSGIGAKLNGGATGIADEAVLDGAKSRLEKARKRLKADRGGSGDIPALNAKIKETEIQIRNDRQTIATLDEKYKTANNLRKEIGETSEKLQSANDRNLLIERWKYVDGQTEKMREKQARLQALNEAYPRGIPTEEEIVRLRDAQITLSGLQGKSSQIAFPAEKRAQLDRLQAVFADELPTDETLREREAEIGEIEDGARAISFTETATSDEYLSLSKKFADRRPDERERETAKTSMDRYRLLERKLREHTEIAAAPAARVGRKSKGYAVAAAVCALLIAGGIACMFFQLIAGIALLAAGVVGLAADGFLYLKNSALHAVPQANAEAVKLKSEMDALEKQTYAFLAPYGYYSADGILYDFARFSSDLQQFEELDEKQRRDRLLLRELKTQNEKRREAAVAYFAKFGIGEQSLRQSLYLLRKNAEDFRRLSDECRRAETDAADVKRRENEEMRAVTAILSAYGIGQTELLPLTERLTEDRKNFIALSEEIGTLDRATAKYIADNDLSERPAGEQTDTAALSEEIQTKQRELLTVEAQIAEDERCAEMLEERISRLEADKETLARLTDRYFVLKETLATINLAEQNLKDRYVLPVKSKFIRYAEPLERALGEKISMDQDFNLSFERGGENRSDKHLSAGQRCICALCFRLALLDNMFEKEQPFIIMDDPFVSLDADHMKKTARLIRELAQDKQIIYFSCHESRKIAD